MINVMDQPWWVDVAVILLPVVLFTVVYELLHWKTCFECGHKATQMRANRYFCDRCYLEKFGPVPVTSVASEKPVEIPLLPPKALPMPSLSRRKAKSDVRRSRKKAG